MLRVLLATAVLAALASPVLANSSLPPARYDVGSDSMTDTQIRAAAEARLGHRVHWHRVAAEGAAALCDRLWADRDGHSFSSAFDDTLWGCAVDDHIVYAFDTPARARKMGRRYYPDLWRRFLRHEVGHLLGWVHKD